MHSTNPEPPTLVRVKAEETNAEHLVEILKRDGAVIVENLISKQAAAQLKEDLKPAFAADGGDATGFFPSTTRRATGLLGISDGFVDLATHPLYNDVASRVLTSEYTYWLGQERHTSISRPQISSTVAFQVNPGSKQQGLHRDEIDYHTPEGEEPMMMGAVTAVTKTTKANGATVVIPGSHKWSGERCPQEHETIAAELEPGDTLMFLGNVYHAGGANTTTNDARETVGIFLCKGMYRQVENQYLMLPPEKAKGLPPKAQRLLGYGISPPFCGFAFYKDPMESIFGVVDEHTVKI